jgi:alpha-1,3-glucosyltransferase
MMITPPSRYPDLFAVLNVLISTPVFVLTWLWSMKCGVEVGWALSGLGSISKPSKVSSEAASNGIQVQNAQSAS